MKGAGAENMRREGFELSVSPPRVVFKEEGGRRLEPLEEVICEVDDEHMGSVIEVVSMHSPLCHFHLSSESMLISTNEAACAKLIPWPARLPGSFDMIA
jgi:predicted membrane GTPase involved in stress response